MLLLEIRDVIVRVTKGNYKKSEMSQVITRGMRDM